MSTQVIVLNGSSSSGKSSIARCLQQVLSQPWLATGVDDFVRSMPPALHGSDAGIDISNDGEVSIGATFRDLERAWMCGVAATARAGAPMIVDDVFLGGAASQRRWHDALDGLGVLWVAVRCDIAEVVRRETARGDRAAGMAESQVALVHEGVHYDVEVDTTCTESIDCARQIAAHVR